MRVIFSDLDGTLLHPQTYSFAPAAQALAKLRGQGIPVVISTSKTRAEVELWRERLGNVDPFITENGGAIFIPRGYFPFPIPGAERRGGYDIVAMGVPYPLLVEALRAAAKETGCEVLGFHDMSVAEISVRTLLPVRQAEFAKQREFDEPFEILGSSTSALLLAIEKRGMRWTRGDRFYHITGPNNKATAVEFLAGLFQRMDAGVETIGIGDGHNDAAFLNVVDVPVIIRSRFAAPLKIAVPSATVTEAPGPYGWNEAILNLLAATPPAGRRVALEAEA
jgi:mannosyl-3-phosphoglycerate phosphatase